MLWSLPQQSSLLLGCGGRGGPGVPSGGGRGSRCGGSRSCGSRCQRTFFYRKRKEQSSEARGPKGEEADSGKFGKHSGWPSTSPSCSYSSNVRARQPHSEDGGGNGRGPTVISIEAATWQLDYRWIRSTLFANQLPFARDACSTPGKAEGFAVSSTAWSSSESGAARFPSRPDPSRPSTEFSAHRIGGPDSSNQWRPSPGPCRGDFNFELSRCDWEGKAPAGARSSEGYFLYQHTSDYGSENEPLYVLKCYAANGTPIQRGDCNTLRGALRWLRQVQGHRANHVASQHHPGSHPGGELECGEGFGGATCTMPRANRSRQWADARHQAARLDPQDLLDLLTSVYADYPKDKLLWPYSANTLRKRLNALQASLGLATTRSADQTPYDLESFRPGGATFYLHLFEDTEFVRRRGRWMSVRSMEIYLQEVATATFQQRLTEKAKERIQQLCLHFPRILVQSRWYMKCHIPPSVWPHLWSAPA